MAGRVAEKSDMTNEKERREIVEASVAAERNNLNSGTAGNISIRLDERMLITPTGIQTACLAVDNIVEMAFDGSFDGFWRPSSEWMMHAEIYKTFPEAAAVVHTHSDHCVAISCLRESIPPFHYMLASFGGDDVRCAGYAPFGSAELARAAALALEGRSACLLANHGAICFAENVQNALAKAVKLETLARQFCRARSLGTPILLGQDEMQEVLTRYGAYGQQRAVR